MDPPAVRRTADFALNRLSVRQIRLGRELRSRLERGDGMIAADRLALHRGAPFAVAERDEEKQDQNDEDDDLAAAGAAPVVPPYMVASHKRSHSYALCLRTLVPVASTEPTEHSGHSNAGIDCARAPGHAKFVHSSQSTSAGWFAALLVSSRLRVGKSVRPGLPRAVTTPGVRAMLQLAWRCRRTAWYEHRRRERSPRTRSAASSNAPTHVV